MQTGQFAVRIHTFSRLRILKGDAPLAFTSKFQHKPLELLKVLLSLGTVNVHVEQIAEALWPESEGDAAQRTFASTLHRLRKLLGHQALVLAQGQLSLNTKLCWVDTLEFCSRLHAASAALESGQVEDAIRLVNRAMELYEGPFLDGQFEPAEILVMRASLHSKFLRHVQLLARALRERTRHAEAARLLTKALEADALAEELYQGLMLALQRQGRNAEALSVYRRCRDIFQAHLGIGPSPETEAIHQALLSRARHGSSGGGAEQEPDEPVQQASREGADPTDGGNSGPNGAPPAETKAESLAPVPTSPANGDARPFIAVLPFANLSEDRAMNALGAGLAEDLITLLSPCRRVRVAACNPAFRSAGAASDVRQVGRELGVSHVVRGSLRFSREEQLSRITVQLADASTGEQVWAAHYDQPLREAFAIEDRMATGICRKMVTALFRSVRDRSADGPS